MAANACMLLLIKIRNDVGGDCEMVMVGRDGV